MSDVESRGTETPADPVALEVFRNLFRSVAAEMGATLMRTACSPNIKERRDYSCAIFDAGGRMTAQGDHMPVHLGSMPLSVQHALAAFRPAPGDVILLNDPYRGGTHLPDLTMVAPVFAPGGAEPLFHVADRAHHADIGGSSPGSMPIAEEIYQEGLIIPPLRIVRGGEMAEDVLDLIVANVRTPEERRGDIAAQIAALRTGERRLGEMIGRYGESSVAAYARALQAYSARLMRGVIRAMPDGTYRFADALDDDGVRSGPVGIRVRIDVRGTEAVVDFAGTAEQTRGNVNANEAIARSAVFYCFRCLLPYRIPSNAGCMAPIAVRVPAGSVLDPRFPAAVAAGNVETSQRIVDTVFGALAQALPDRIPAASSGTMNNLTIGGRNPKTGEPYAYYETIAGGMGARPGRDGLDAVHTHMTNTMNTPIEALERYYPFRVTRYSIERGTGGRGRFRGGDGIRRDIRLMADADVTVISDRRERGPWGLAGGEAGAPGRTVRIAADGTEEAVPGKTRVRLEPGETISIRSPGGGGFGEPEAPADPTSRPTPERRSKGR